MEFILNELIQQVMTARATLKPVLIRGGGTKDFYGEPSGSGQAADTAILDMSAYTGIVNYQPSELVITARAGSLLSDIEATLTQQQQMLAFEPPRLGATATLGGCIASGLSGPRRMAVGGLRDFVLGARLLDSTGSVLNFGGEVMKNVAGYDVSRLLAGSMGIFGPLLEVSLKVVPRPEREITLTLEMSESQALDALNEWRGLPLPISASVWSRDDQTDLGVLHLRLSGSEAAIVQGRAHIGGQEIQPQMGDAFWTSLRDQTHSFFQQRPLWRVAVPPTTPALNMGNSLIEWNGGLRWLAQQSDPLALREQVAALGGHATLYRYQHKLDDLPVFHPLHPGLQTIHWRLKQEFDPMGIFNPRRLFRDF
ncbi:MAG: glycolate oxidase subunit GlcE [Burkholderiaceae bacterium]|nr:glycolate oxidase subunit GlcE [Burkholderiaceae bacterium]